MSTSSLATNRSKTTYRLVHEVSGHVVLDCVLEATTWAERGIGLIGKPCPARGAGMLFRKTGGIHTWGMAYPIDVIMLTSSNQCVMAKENVRPNSIIIGPKTATTVIEMREGTLRECELLKEQDKYALIPNARIP